MPIPQDSRSPHRQQRWIELHNVGSDTIPAFGIVEIVESHRPEQAGLVPGDGPTVVKVKKPTMDSLSHFLINGPLDIPIGKRGRIGTNDYPCLVAYEPQYTPNSGEIWGTIKDSYLAGKGRQGLAIIGDADATMQLVRVNRAERLIRVTPTQTTIQPGGIQDCYVLRWAVDEWVQTSTVIKVDDEFFRVCVLPGEEFWCESYGPDLFQPVSEFGLRRRGYAVTQIQPNSTGLVNISSIQPAGGGVVPSCIGNRLGPVVEACYRTQAGTAINVDDEVFVHYHPEFRRWFILPIGSTLVRFEMKTPLPLGGQGEAIEIGTGPAFTPIGLNFPIKDYSRNPGMFRFDPRSNSQARGYMGWCVIPANPEIGQDGRPIREIVQMEHIAHSIEFKLLSDISGGKANAEVTNYYIGKDPMDTDLLRIGQNSWFSVEVYDAQSNYPYGWINSKGKARYNDRLHRYEIIECNQMAIFLYGNLSAAMCPSDASATIGNFGPMTFPPYGATKPADSLTAINSYSLAGMAGAPVGIMWNESFKQWEIFQVGHISKYFVDAVGLSSGTCSLTQSVTLLEIAAMTCGNASVDSDQIGFTSIDIVSGVSVTGCSMAFSKKTICVLSSVAAATDAILFDTKTVVTGSRMTSPTANDPTTCKLELKTEDICVLTPSSPVTAYSTLISFMPELVVQDVNINGLCIEGSVRILYVACLGDTGTTTFFCGTECTSGSGSGSGQGQGGGGGQATMQGTNNPPSVFGNAPGGVPGKFIGPK